MCRLHYMSEVIFEKDSILRGNVHKVSIHPRNYIGLTEDSNARALRDHEIIVMTKASWNNGTRGTEVRPSIEEFLTTNDGEASRLEELVEKCKELDPEKRSLSSSNHAAWQLVCNYLGVPLEVVRCTNGRGGDGVLAPFGNFLPQEV